jgi:hypothetical protein
MAIMLSNVFQGQTDRGLIYLSNHSWETQLSNQEEEVGNLSAARKTNVFSHFAPQSLCFVFIPVIRAQRLSSNICFIDQGFH